MGVSGRIFDVVHFIIPYFNTSAATPHVDACWRAAAAEKPDFESDYPDITFIKYNNGNLAIFSAFNNSAGFAY